MPSLRPAWLALLSTGCIDDLLEAPYILATGVGREPVALSLTPRQSLVVGGPDGVREVSGSGEVQVLLAEPAIAVAAHLGWLAWSDAQAVHLLLDDGQRRQVGLPDVVALLAWCDARLLALTPSGIWLIDVDGTAPTRWGEALPGAVDLTLGPGPACSSVLQLSPERLVRTDAQGSTTLASGLHQARAVAVDRYEVPWIIHQDPPVLARIEGGAAVLHARHLGDSRDLSFGNGGLLHVDTAWLLHGEGRIDYLPLPTRPPAAQ